MRFSAKTLKNVDSLNSWQYAENWIVRQNGNTGEASTLYYQLVDLDRDGIRYIPSNTATMTVVFESLDDTMVVTKTAVIAFADDRSIWKIQLSAADLPSSGNVIFTLTDGGNSYSFNITNGISVDLVNAGAC